jgi:hypothetical protein
MTMAEKLRIVLLTGVVGFVGLQVADKLTTRLFQHHLDCRARRASTDARQAGGLDARYGVVQLACITVRLGPSFKVKSVTASNQGHAPCCLHTNNVSCWHQADIRIPRLGF